MPKMRSGKLTKNLNEKQSEDWKGFAEEFQTGTDRATAILGGVFLDEHLQVLLKNFLVDEKSIIDELFGVEKPLSTFSARTKMAYALGLINKEIFDDLDRIRNIRNSFAHALHGLSFSHVDISQWCRSLIISSKLIPPNEDEYPPRTLYISAVLFISSYLQAKGEQVKKMRRVVSKDTFGIEWTPVGNPEKVKPTNPYFAVEKAETSEADEQKNAG